MTSAQGSVRLSPELYVDGVPRYWDTVLKGDLYSNLHMRQFGMPYAISGGYPIVNTARINTLTAYPCMYCKSLFLKSVVEEQKGKCPNCAGPIDLARGIDVKG